MVMPFAYSALDIKSPCTFHNPDLGNSATDSTEIGPVYSVSIPQAAES